MVAEGTVDEAEEVGTPEASAREAEASGDDAEERRPTRQQRQRRAPKRCELQFSDPVQKLSLILSFGIVAEPEDEPKPRKKAKAADSSAIPLEDHCIICASARDPTKLLICDGCERVFHLYCLTPPLAKVPRGKWFCPDCHRAKYPTPAYERSAFGMTLQEFQEVGTAFSSIFCVGAGPQRLLSETAGGYQIPKPRTFGHNDKRGSRVLEAGRKWRLSFLGRKKILPRTGHASARNVRDERIWLPWLDCPSEFFDSPSQHRFPYHRKESMGSVHLLPMESEQVRFGWVTLSNLRLFLTFSFPLSFSQSPCCALLYVFVPFARHSFVYRLSGQLWTPVQLTPLALRELLCTRTELLAHWSTSHVVLYSASFNNGFFEHVRAPRWTGGTSLFRSLSLD